MRRPTQQRLTMRNLPIESVRRAGAKNRLAATLAISLLGALPFLRAQPRRASSRSQRTLKLSTTNFSSVAAEAEQPARG